MPVVFEPKKPIQLKEILGKADHAIGAYKIKDITFDLSPRALPKTGDLVIIEAGSCPKGMENNAVYIRDIPESREYDVWMPTYRFFIGQIVSFWKGGYQYDFQIQYSDFEDENLGKFVLVNKVVTIKQPGVGYRTAKSKMRPK